MLAITIHDQYVQKADPERKTYGLEDSLDGFVARLEIRAVLLSQKKTIRQYETYRPHFQLNDSIERRERMASLSLLGLECSE